MIKIFGFVDLVILFGSCRISVRRNLQMQLLRTAELSTTGDKPHADFIPESSLPQFI
jgi:hypothetical protein